MERFKIFFKSLKFFLLIVNLIVVLWLVVTKNREIFLVNFVLISLFFISIFEILLTFIGGLRTKIYYFSIMSFVCFLFSLFFLISQEFFFGELRIYFLGLSIDFFTEIFIFLLILLYFYRSFTPSSLFKKKLQLKPYTIISFSFLFLITLGSILLYFPFSKTKVISYLDCLFTSASAVCVTGLSVIDVGNDLTFFGKIILITLVQLGGLGLMSFTALFSYLIGEKMSVFERITIQNALSTDNLSVISRFTTFIVLITFLFEGVGAIIFFLRFKDIMPLNDAIFYSVFHSISAFCNAGFSLWPDSFMRFRTDFLINVNLMTLIVIGGIGFPVLYNIYSILKGKEKRLTLHTKLVLITTVALIFFGSLVIFLLEYDNQLKDLKIYEKILASFFAAITPRTAGFNTIDYKFAKHATLLFTCILMFIGASPGSTGGGIKTTSFAVILMNTLNVLKDRKVVNLFKREISFDSIRKSLVVFILSLNLILLQSVLIVFLEPQFGLERVIFEVVSAFGTVGLSTGITPFLSSISKILIIITMFLGRVGTITIIFSLGLSTKQILSKFPEENIITG